MKILRNITFWIFTAALSGILLAWLIGPDGSTGLQDSIGFLKTTFLSLLRMLIAPMIFFSLIGGLVSIGSTLRLKQLGGYTVLYYFGTTTIAILVGLGIVFFLHPWTQYPPLEAMAGSSLTNTPKGGLMLIDPASESLVGVLTQIAAQAFVNPFTALATTNIIGIVANAILIGIAMLLVLPQDSALHKLTDQANKVISRVLSWIILTLPVGIFAIMFDFTQRLSGDGQASEQILTQLLSFAILVFSATMFHGLLVLPLIAWLFTGRSPVQLIRKLSRPLLVALGTSSSSATLPVSLKCAEEELEVSASVRSFMLPLGATMNMDGSALFEALAAVFLAYLYGIPLSNLAMVTIFLMTMIASIGAPGMPSASMAGMQIILLSVGIPLEAIGLLLVIERPLDTFRTAVNVEGDLIGTTVVQGVLDRSRQ